MATYMVLESIPHQEILYVLNAKMKSFYADKIELLSQGDTESLQYVERVRLD